MTTSEDPRDADGRPEFTGRDVLYRQGGISAPDVQRAPDALLRQGTKPSVAALREQLGGGSPNTITPLLARYWERLGSRLGEGPESLERVPEALARVTELLWRRALEEARERMRLVQQPDQKPEPPEELQGQIGKLSVALAEARAREGEHLTELTRLIREQAEQRTERTRLLVLLKGAQALLNSGAVSSKPGALPLSPRAKKPTTPRRLRVSPTAKPTKIRGSRRKRIRKSR